MQRLRISRHTPSGLEALCVMRRQPDDLPVMGSFAYDSLRFRWEVLGERSLSAHRTPRLHYDTIVQFTNGMVAMVHDDYVEQALRELGLREVTA